MEGALARLGRVTELVPRVHAVRARIERLPAEEAVDALEAALSSRHLDPGLLLACGLALLDHDVAPLQRSAAGRAPRTELFLSDAPAHRALARGGRLPDIGMLEEHPCRVPLHASYLEPIYEKAYEGDAFPYRNWSWKVVGHEVRTFPIKTLPRLYARKRRALFSRAVRHPSAAFLGRLLHSPDLLPADALAIAVRRPLTDAIARTLVNHVPTITQPDVRLALVLNPFTPTRIALRLVPSCANDLRTIAGANVHPLVRALAAQL